LVAPVIESGPLDLKPGTLTTKSQRVKWEKNGVVQLLQFHYSWPQEVVVKFKTGKA
jgi:hypothetical protein